MRKKKKMRGTKEKEDSNIERKKKAFGTLSSPNVFTYFASNLYPVIFQKGLDMANQAITNLQTNLRHPSHPMNESFSPSTSPAGIRQCALRTTPLASPDLCQEVGHVPRAAVHTHVPRPFGAPRRGCSADAAGLQPGVSSIFTSKHLCREQLCSTTNWP